MEECKDFVSILYDRKNRLSEELEKKQEIVNSFKREGWSESEISTTLLNSIKELKYNIDTIDSLIQTEYTDVKERQR